MTDVLARPDLISGGVRPRIIPDPGKQSELYFRSKRSMDVALTLLLLVCLWPVLLLIAVCIKLDSSGPVLFTQRRVGVRPRFCSGHVVWDVREFLVYKFRSMVDDADPAVHQEYIKAFVEGRVDLASDSGSRFKLTHDRRVTRFGRLLRRTSLDELPQLVNVLKGEMSLVGPRPVPTYEVSEYEERHYERLAALPGITGIWQVRGRCQVPFEQMVQMDIEYVHTRSTWLDIRLLLLTVPAVLSGRGAE
ncbi:MAG: sugar transferase [Chloroflexi bacterium]|nr:sugar transferase [Chloroflexota bacterium]